MHAHAPVEAVYLYAMLEAIEEATKAATTLEEIQLLRRLIARAKELSLYKYSEKVA
jgi:hypothetical protein